MIAPQTPHAQRRHIQVRGIVQGVGFRPFVYNLATSLHLSGFVFNSSAGVTIERYLPTLVRAMPAGATSAILPIGALHIHSPIAPIAGRDTPSSRVCRTTVQPPPCLPSSCAVTAGRNTKIPATGASTLNQMRVAFADRHWRCSRAPRDLLQLRRQRFRLPKQIRCPSSARRERSCGKARFLR
jgi:hypothetical protein